MMDPVTMTLVIGYGNELRGDDAVGPRTAVLAAERFPDRVRAIACHQLLPELAEAVATAECVIFIDATVDSPGDAAPAVTRLLPDGTVRGVGHSLHPAGLLDLARVLYGQAPPAWLIAIPVSSVALGEPLSPTAEAGLTRALEQIETLCAPHRAP